MLLLLFLISYLIIIITIYALGIRNNLRYNLFFLLISISYIYLFANILELSQENNDSLGLKYIVVAFIFHISLAVSFCLSFSKMRRKTIINKLDILVDQLTSNCTRLYVYTAIYLLTFIFVRHWVSYEESSTHRFMVYGSTVFFENFIRNSLITILPVLITISGLRILKIWPIILIAVLIFVQAIEGERILLLTIAFAIYYGLFRIRGYKIPVLILLLASVAGLFIIVTIGHSRWGTDARQNVVNFIDNVKNIDINSYNPISIGEFYMPAHSIIEVLEGK